MLTPNIKSKINWLWDRFWAGGLSNPITAIEQISYLLFMKRLEETNEGRFFQYDERYKWSYFSTQIEDSSELLRFVKYEVFPYIKNLYNENQPFANAMSTAVFLIEKPSLLKEAIEIINEIYEEINQQKLDGQHFQNTLGDLYEHLLKATNEAGKIGQFRTPRHIIQLMCEILEPDLDGKICDLTSGSADFLVGSYQHIVSKYSTVKDPDENGLRRGIEGDELSGSQWDKLKNSIFFGFDIDQTILRIGMMNLIMHGITEPNVFLIDTLSDTYDKFEPDEQYKYILANPPFGGSIDRSSISYKLQRLGTNKSELLFLYRIIHMLEIGGKAAVIVPEGVLFSSTRAYKSAREILLKDCDLEAVISLPSGVFLPYAGVKTSILFFTKRKLGSGTYHTQKVWFYGMESDGYSLDTNRKKLKDNPLPRVINALKSKKDNFETDREAQYFYVPIDEIIKNKLELSFNKYHRFVYEEETYAPPQELMASLIKLESEILKELKELNNLI